MKKLPLKIKFRKMTVKDAHSLLKIYSDKEAMKYRGSKPMESIEDAREFVNTQELLKGTTLTIREGIESLEENKIIGSVMFRFNESKKEECEIGYSIGRKFWGKGYGKEIVKLMLKSLEQNRAITNIIAWSNKMNIASIKILERNGFERIKQVDENADNYLYQKQK
ncbi:MAG: GNAT family N-acetyltransferase [Saprospiraceae bacterium]